MKAQEVKTENNNIEAELLEIFKAAKSAARELSVATTESKNTALKEAAKAIRANTAKIIEANNKDAEQAKANGISAAFLDRLLLDEKRIEAIAKGLEDVAALADPVNKVLSSWERPNGLKISRVSTPLGVIGVIYESRPNVTADAGGLCLKAGNAAVLRGGSESFHSSRAILECLQQGLQAAGLPLAAIQSIPTTDRAAVGIMLKASDYIDVIVPRGGKGLIKRVTEETRIPTFQHLDGNCTTYIHEKADLEKAVNVTVNAKMRRTGICGATENLLLDSSIAKEFLPKISEALIAKGCELRGDETSRKLDPRINPAVEDDYYTEYEDSILAIKVIDGGVEEAVKFINHYGSSHTESIITEDEKAAETFMNKVASSIVIHNASTQFADGGEFGMGAEIGIATGKMHARGPVGVEQLCTFKYKVEGNGQTRA
jgi:glutamate-5-semialdehyde dehydrogenase